MVGVVVVVVVGMVVGGRALVGQKREGRGPADRRRQRSPAAGSRLLRAARPGHRRPPTHLGIPSPGPPFPGGRYLQRPVRRAAPRR